MKLHRVITAVLIAASFTIFACSDDGGSGKSTNGLKSDSGEVLGNSIIDLPASLSSGQPSKGTGDNPCECDNDDELIDIYQGIRCYVSIAEEIKNGVRELIIAIGDVLPYLPVGKEFVVTDPKPEDPVKVLLEKPEGEAYQWKLSFYFYETGGPEMVVRFTFEGQGAKGRLVWIMVEEDEELAEIGIHENVDHAIDVVFDGTASVRTLEVKYQQDLSGILAIGQAGTLDGYTRKQRERVLGQPDRIFLNTILDGEAGEYTIYGTSHHPGWAILDHEIFGDERNMYLFKAKAKADAGQEAKLYLSLPLETRDDNTGVWEDDSVGVVITDFLWGRVNTILAKLSDGVDDPVENPDDPEDPFIGDVAAEQQLADFIIYWITGENPAVDYSITKAELETFVFSDQSADPDAEIFQSQYKSISYIINPAFYDAADGFLGTYDENRDLFYVYNGTMLWEGSKPANFSSMNALDLSGVEPYVPAQVVAHEITVE